MCPHRKYLCTCSSGGCCPGSMLDICIGGAPGPVIIGDNPRGKMVVPGIKCGMLGGGPPGVTGKGGWPWAPGRTPKNIL